GGLDAEGLGGQRHRRRTLRRHHHGNIRGMLGKEGANRFETHDGRRVQMLSRRRALAFSTFGRISSRISSLAKSAIQRSGVITGQSEPNSILSCKMLLM